MSSKKEESQSKPEGPRFVDYCRIILQAKLGPKLFGTVPIAAPLLDSEALQECASQVVQSLPLNEAQKERVKNLIVHFSSQVQNQVDVSFVKGLAQFFVQGIRYIPGDAPEKPEIVKGRKLT